MSATVYDRWAALFDYPDAKFGEALAAAPGDAAPFVTFARSREASEMEELYTRTFDINPVCSLETGWQLFGEDYKRGAFLVEMRQRLQEAEIPEGTELPDHLGYTLRLLGRLLPTSATSSPATSSSPPWSACSRGSRARSTPTAA
ncbi:MAG: hypothetical protein HC813_01110 [Planctomycetes bacterium]|nr:hypothetical protein [Planctomycetota bacterium]